MTIYEELQARGLIAQVTDEEEIKELINNGKATFYIGFDPTADSLHVGHFMALMLMTPPAKGGQPAHRPHRRRHWHGGRPFGPHRYADYDDGRDHSAQLRLLQKADGAGSSIFPMGRR